MVLFKLSFRLLCLEKNLGADPMTDEDTLAGFIRWCGKNYPADRNIRIAPTLPPVEELKQAVEVLCTCIKLAALEKLGI